MSDGFARSKAMSAWGSGLMAIDIIVKSGSVEVFDITSGGTCANVLSGLATFGWNAKALGRIGDDPAGNLLVDELRVSGVDPSNLLLSKNVATPLIVERFGIPGDKNPGHRFEWKCPVCGSPVPRFRPSPIDTMKFEPGNSPSLFFFDRPTPANLKLAESLRNEGAIVMFEPPRLKEEREFERAISVSDIVKVAGSEASDTISDRLESCPLAIITYGSAGLEYRATRFNGISHGWTALPAIHVAHPVDSCGSGDWLTVGFLHAFFAVNDLSCDGHMLGASLKYGQALAALNCLLPGARGLSRLFDRTEISEMVGVSLAKGLSSLESCFVEKTGVVRRRKDVHLVCNSCIK